MALWAPWRRTGQPSTLDAMTAAARQVNTKDKFARTASPSYQSWQTEAWAFYDSLGEFRYAVEWKSEMISRVRLRAGQVKAGQDEPQILDSGPQADLVNELAGGIGGQSSMLDTLATQINVPGEAFVLGETKDDGENHWSIKSADEIRIKRTKMPGTNPDGSPIFSEYEVIDEATSDNTRTNWRPVAPESLIVRVWRPHKRYGHIADSPARAMRSTMRELELVNRKIQAHYLSRLASAGVFIMPDEVTFPTRPEFAEAPDPFMAEWIEIAKEAIQQPGSASAAVPIPMRVPAEYAKAFNFIDFTIKDDDKTIEKRESAIRRLASQVDVPAEIILGMGDVNHWSAWQLEEGAIKTHISSDVETICAALTIGYLWPRLRAAGVKDWREYVIWYDTSELTARPNKSDVAKDAYDRLEITGKAYRRELGFDEDDAPTAADLKEMALRKLAVNPQVGMAALGELVGEPELAEIGDTGPEEEVPPEQTPDKDPNQLGPPDTKNKEPEPRPDKATQAATSHRLLFTTDGWTLYHPSCCHQGVMSCPVTEGTRFLSVYPGQSGVYECWLASDGNFILGRRTYERLDEFIQGHTRKTRVRTLGNGHH